MFPDDGADAGAESPTLSSPAPSGLAPPGPPVLGGRLGPYLVQRVLGQGATSVVYCARDEGLGRDVALKVLRPNAGESLRARFLREGRIVARLAHPNVVTVYAAGEDDGRLFSAMELLPGSLADELSRRGKLPWPEALHAARDACQGLEAAREKGIIHRDVKPSNLLRDAAGVVKVGDFGLAKDLSRALELTAEGVVVGTPHYVSPEQGCGRPVDHRSDLYSLGATLFHLLTGRPPFEATNPFDVIVRHSVEPPPILGEDVPSGVGALVHALLDKAPERRPQSYRAVIDRIQEALTGQAEPPATAPLPARRTTADPLGASQLGAARAALGIGRHARAREIYERLFRERGPGWIEAAFGLAPVLEGASDFGGARAALEAVVSEAPDADLRAMALWSLGTLAEKESEAALDRALDAYRRVLEVSGTAFPKNLLEARMARLGRKGPGGAA